MRECDSRAVALLLKAPKAEPSDTLPIKPLIEQLTFVRRTFRDILRHYGISMEGLAQTALDVLKRPLPSSVARSTFVPAASL